MEGEVHWKHQEIFGTVCQGCLGLGNHIKKMEQGQCQRKEGANAEMAVQKVREAAEEDCCLQTEGFPSHWVQCDQALERPLTWSELWSTN